MEYFSLCFKVSKGNSSLLYRQEWAANHNCGKLGTSAMEPTWILEPLPSGLLLLLRKIHLPIKLWISLTREHWVQQESAGLCQGSPQSILEKLTQMMSQILRGKKRKISTNRHTCNVWSVWSFYKPWNKQWRPSAQMDLDSSFAGDWWRVLMKPKLHDDVSPGWKHSCEGTAVILTMGWPEGDWGPFPLPVERKIWITRAGH